MVKGLDIVTFPYSFVSHSWAFRIGSNNIVVKPLNYNVQNNKGQNNTQAESTHRVQAKKRKRHVQSIFM